MLCVSCLVHMFKMLTLLSILLLSSHVLPLVQSLNCAKITEYIETFENPVRSQCCKNCAPGQFMVKRCTPGSPNTVCGTCNNGYFTDKYNIMFQWCKQCKKCTKEHMKYEKNCTLTRDAVCTCDDGYICNGSQCDTCVEVKTPRPPFAKPAPFTKHAPSSNPEPFSKPDNVWILVSLCFACVCVCVLFTCFLLISRHAWPCKRIMSTSIGHWFPQKSYSGSSECTEEEEEKVPMPVQEVCGKDEKLEEA
ncbi:uncharacterized protein [Misgurnus anguillicaudatus]|uniref:uncharacterized protein isoform X5 n=1 Tax=Misgurnus anguillicaudatus TaxID=75329 RepID=UPI003CCFA42B